MDQITSAPWPDTAASSAWPRVAVMGAGAVGSYFGGMLARAGAPVVLIGRGAHIAAIAGEGLFIDSIHFQQRVGVRAATEPSAARGARLILFTVKTTDRRAAAAALAPHLDAQATVVSLQNGVDNAQEIRAAAGFEVLPAAVYVAAEIIAPGRVKHSARGDLIIGSLEAGREPQARAVAEAFARAGVPCRVSPDIAADLWTKMIMNCAGNAPTTLARSTYRQAAENAEVQQVVRGVAEECLAVARGDGVTLPGNIADAAITLARNLGAAISSTAQDIARGKRTEIDSLNGYIVRRGRELGIATPINHALWALTKLLEETEQRRQETALQRASSERGS